AMRTQLMTSLTGQFDREVEGSMRRIEEAIGPYTRFVRAERDQLTLAREELNAVNQGLMRLRSRVESL
ncbi:MAG TPA: dynamin, partial [Myxococcota bacterium]|nr:dynamin [Myxococcota bacterium]